MRLNRNTFVKSCQMLALLLVVVALGSQSILNYPRDPYEAFLLELEKTWRIPQGKNTTGLSDLEDFRFIINNASVCVTSDHEASVYLIVIVHSLRSHVEERQAIRETWGSFSSVNNVSMRVVFLLGSDHFQRPPKVGRSTGDLIQIESNEQGDIILGSFQDNHKNLTYMHLMGYKWVLEFCSSAPFVLKTDEDVFVDIPELVKIIKSNNLQNRLLCHEMRGYAPQRMASINNMVTNEEYPHDLYPAYCTGWAYVISQDALRRIFKASQTTRFFLVDDVYVTGMLREFAEETPGILPLNEMYNFNPNVSQAWKSYYKTGAKPFIVSTLQEHGQFSVGDSMKFLWASVNSL